jgi:GNAT superfamily N-acetyltransferase
VNLVIRRMLQDDIDAIVETFLVWHKYRPQYERYYAEQQRGERDVLVALHQNGVVGYGTVVWDSGYAAFRAAGIPEIVDLNVISGYQRQGIGTTLIHAAEALVRIHGKTIVGIAVEQTPEYAAPNRLYPQLGFVPGAYGLMDDGRDLLLVKQLRKYPQQEE